MLLADPSLPSDLNREERRVGLVLAVGDDAPLVLDANALLAHVAVQAHAVDAEALGCFRDRRRALDRGSDSLGSQSLG